jgi:hypothetical protein
VIRDYAVHEGARIKDIDANRLNFALLGQKIVLISHKRLRDNGSPATQSDPLSMSALGQKQTLKQVHANVRFTPKSRHWLSVSECPLCAKSGHYAPRQRTWLFDHLVGDRKHARRNCKA